MTLASRASALASTRKKTVPTVDRVCNNSKVTTINVVITMPSTTEITETMITNRRAPSGRLFISACVTAFLLLMLIGCGERTAQQNETTGSSNAQSASVTRPALSDTALAGETVFNTKCSLCHGANADGTNLGPPLIHKIYEPGHHSDDSIRLAVRQGVRQHHWQFGNMPPVPSVSEDDVEKIICYVREMQRANGIFEGEVASTAC